MKMQLNDSVMKRTYVAPERIVWKSEGVSAPRNAELLLGVNPGQVNVWDKESCKLEHNGQPSGILLDFGRELHGGIQIFFGNLSAPDLKLRIRLGESVTEAMNDLRNEHSVRDAVFDVPWMGMLEFGQTGFRFLRIDTVGEKNSIEIRGVRAVSIMRDDPLLGSFRCSDKQLDRIWATGARTVHLCMQEYLFDGPKRDRLVWIGDIVPEADVISTVFGNHMIIPKSLDFIRDKTPPVEWMNTISSYSLWWIVIQRNWFFNHGDLNYLKSQMDYLWKLVRHISVFIDKNGKHSLPSAMLDHPTALNPEAVAAGTHAHLFLALTAAEEIFKWLNLHDKAVFCAKLEERLAKRKVDHKNSKTAAAMFAISGLAEPTSINSECLAREPLADFSPFFAHFILEARVMAGDHQGCIDAIRKSWGGMLSLGATSFWEHFDVNWLENAGRIDEIVPEWKLDVHKDRGEFCFKGLRHSLCHGWSAGPTAWLSRHILGFQPSLPGGMNFYLRPQLCDLKWAEGAWPTSEGVIFVRHEKTRSGRMKTEIKAPKGVKIRVS